jgi:hypothetical protein
MEGSLLGLNWIFDTFVMFFFAILMVSYGFRFTLIMYHDKGIVRIFLFILEFIVVNVLLSLIIDYDILNLREFIEEPYRLKYIFK